ncbi:MAG: hypothetical protein WA484_03865 [Solirubrobacteraceae bacterium]
MQTYRDAEIVAWIGGLGAAGAEHVMRRFGMGRSMAYHRLGSLTSDGLLEHHAVLFGRSGMYSATSSGLRWQGLDHFALCRVRAGGFEHAWQVAHAAVELHRVMPGWDVLSEREVRSIENDRGELFGSVQVGQLGGRPLLHRPDLALVSPGACVVPVEVELSVKSASRLAAICRGWARARHIERVYYLAARGPGRAVERAVRATKAADRVRVLGLNDVASLAAEQRTGMEASCVRN